MSNILSLPVSFWHKTPTGRVSGFSTNSKHTADAMKRDMNVKRPDGTILRSTKQEAEKDPTP